MLLVFLLSNCRSSACILDTGLLFNLCLANVFFLSVACLFTFLMISLDEQFCMCAKSLQSCLTLCDPVDCRLPGTSVHGILQARILCGLPCPPAGDLHNPGMEPRFPTLQADSLPAEPQGKLQLLKPHLVEYYWNL